MELFELYLSKLSPKIDFLWQRPKKKVLSTDAQWFDGMRVSENRVNNFMKILSEKAGLSRIYTNHCCRATCITNLSDAGFEARDIMSLSSHTAEASIMPYCQTSSSKKQNMSSALNKNFGSSICKPKSKPCTVTSATVNSPDVPPVAKPPLVDSSNEIDADILQLLSSLEENQENVSPGAPIGQAENALCTIPIANDPVPLVPNVMNVQNSNPVVNYNLDPNMSTPMNVRTNVPTMSFPHSTVTINYNYYPQK